MSTVTGGIGEHIAFLKKTVVGKLPRWKGEGTFEQRLVKELLEALDNLNSGPLVQNMSAKYFAENLRAMLQECEVETADEPSNLMLNVSILTNIKHYRLPCNSGKTGHSAALVKPHKKEQKPRVKQAVASNFPLTL